MGAISIYYFLFLVILIYFSKKEKKIKLVSSEYVKDDVLPSTSKEGKKSKNKFKGTDYKHSMAYYYLFHRLV